MRPVVGIDLSARRGLDVALLDEELRLAALVHCEDVGETVSWLTTHASTATVGIDAPQGPRLELLAAEALRACIEPPPPAGRYLRHRVCDYHLVRRGIGLYLSPAAGEPVPAWMAAGFDLFSALRARGYRAPTSAGDHGATLLEVYPYSIFVCLLGAIPPRKSTPVGKAMRRALLERAGVLGLPANLTHDQLDAAAAALGAACFARGIGCAVGDAAEGYLILPVPETALRTCFGRHTHGAPEACRYL